MGATAKPRRTVTTVHGFCWFYWTTNSVEESPIATFKPIPVRFLGLIDPVSTRLDAIEKKNIYDNVKNAAIAYATIKSRDIFVHDVLTPEDPKATTLTTKDFAFTHERIGWESSVLDWLTQQTARRRSTFVICMIVHSQVTHRSRVTKLVSLSVTALILGSVGGVLYYPVYRAHMIERDQRSLQYECDIPVYGFSGAQGFYHNN